MNRPSLRRSPHSDSLTAQRTRAPRRLPWRVRARFYENAADLLPEGQSPARVLHLLSQELLRLRRKSAAQSVRRVAVEVEGGSPLSVALGAGLTDMELSLLEIGEARSGQGGLVKMMKDILETRARMQRLTEVAWGSLFEPIVYMLTMYAFFYVLGAYIVPTIEPLLPRQRWTISTHILAAMGSLGVGIAPIAFAVGTFVLIAIVAYTLPRWSGRGRVFVEEWFFVFTFYRELQGLLWLLGFAVQSKNGVPEPDAIAQQIENASPYLASRLRPVYSAVRKGEALGSALRQTGYAFPSAELIERIAVLENGHAEALERLARTHIDKLEKRMRMVARVAGFIALIGIFAVIGVVSVAANGLAENLATAVGS